MSPPDNSQEHHPRAVIADLTDDMEPIVNTAQESSVEESFDINSYSLIDIWEKRIKQRLEELGNKNDNAQQDRGVDVELAPLYLEVLHRRQKEGSSSFKNKTPRLHSQFDLYEYVNQLYEVHRSEGRPWPMRLRAAVLSLDAQHDLAYDIYADPRGISILSVDSLSRSTVKDELENRNLTIETTRNIKSINSDAIAIQDTSFGCEMHVYHALKVFFKREDVITQNRHLANLAKERASPAIELRYRFPTFHDSSDSDSDATEKKDYPAKNKLFLSDFFKTMQNFSHFNDVAGAKNITVGKYRNEKLEDYKERVFQEMFLMSDEKNSKKKAKINTKVQRQRLRLYTDVLALINELRQQHGDNASKMLGEIIEANTPMIPRDWQQSIPSWVNHPSDLISGPVHLLSNKAEKKLSGMTSIKQLEAIHELLDATDKWQIPSLRLAAISAVEQYSPTTVEQLESVFSRLTNLKLQWQEKAPRVEIDILNNKLDSALKEITKKFGQTIPAEKMTDTLENLSPQLFEILINTNHLGEKMNGFAVLKHGDAAVPVAMLEIMALKEIKIGKNEIQFLANSFIRALARSDGTWAKVRFVEWFNKSPSDIQEPLKNAMQKFFPTEMALLKKRKLVSQQQNLISSLSESLQKLDGLPLLQIQGDEGLIGLREELRTELNAAKQHSLELTQPGQARLDIVEVRQSPEHGLGNPYEKAVEALQQQEQHAQNILRRDLQRQQERMLMLLNALQLPLLRSTADSQVSTLEETLRTHSNAINEMRESAQRVPIPKADLQDIHEHVLQLTTEDYESQVNNFQQQELRLQQNELQNLQTAIGNQITRFHGLPLAPQNSALQGSLLQLHQEINQLFVVQTQQMGGLPLITEELRQLRHQCTQFRNRHQTMEEQLSQLEQTIAPGLVQESADSNFLRRWRRNIRNTGLFCCRVEMPDYSDLYKRIAAQNVLDELIGKSITPIHYRRYQPNNFLISGNPTQFLSEAQRVAEKFESTNNSFTLRSVEEHLQSIHPRGTVFTSLPLRDSEGNIDLQGAAYLKVIHFEKTPSGEKKIVPTLNSENEEIFVRVKATDLKKCALEADQLVTTSIKNGQINMQPVAMSKKRHDAGFVESKDNKATKRKSI